MPRAAVSAVPRPDAPPQAVDEARVTPMMAQYVEIKAANPDCLLFYRMGDFYELFFADAEVASRALGIVLTKRGKHGGADVPMCGVPIERADDYLSRLIALGHRVAVCEQMEDPAEAKKRGGKSVVRRDVVRLVTPGTITEDRLLEPARANLLLALARRPAGAEGAWCYGLAALDISTGRFTLAEVEAGRLAAEIARLEPREIVLAEAMHADPDLGPLWRDAEIAGAALTPIGRAEPDPEGAARRLREALGVATLEGFGAFTRAELAAAGVALLYVERTQVGARPPLRPPSRESVGASVAIDAATRANLELTRTLAGDRAGSLLGAIDRTVTASGARLLAERLAAPSTDLALLGERGDALAFLVADASLRQRLRRALAGAPDVARALSRIGLGRAGPRDLAALRDGLEAARAIAVDLAASGALAEEGALPAEVAAAARALGAPDPDVAEALGAALADELPLLRRDGGFLREGFSRELDEARLLGADSRRFIAELQARYVGETGCRTLRIKHNGVLGYFVEVPQGFGEECLKGPWRETFVHRQTMVDAMRFTSLELGELEGRIAGAAERALGLELATFDDLARKVLADATAIAAAASALSVLDVTAGLAELAVEREWVRPRLDAGLAFRVVGGRHPVVEAALASRGEPFIANDVDLSGTGTGSGADDGGRILLVTGPNMGGKSTYLRQCALIAVLAQTGSFVPAREAHLGLVDRLFSRVGAADDIARGRSTFMVEMVETAAILNQATRRSLVILDEIGRGTATFDGLSIAWAALEHLHGANRGRALFATHFHELTALAERLPRLSNATLKVTEWHGDVVFLHEVVPGAADRSYGIQVARLAGLPEAVVERAKAILAALERGGRERPGGGRSGGGAGLAELPLFAAAAETVPAATVPAPAPVPMPAAPDPVALLLDDLDPDAMTPRAALDALYALKRARTGA